ncbi:MAG: NfeD family protein [Acidimicrobiales bacterium]|nr:NfeD family protein [Acidimicrobiales bacterium]
MTSRVLSTRVVAGLVLAVLGATLLAGTAGASQTGADEGGDEAGVVRVLKVSGLLDPILVSFVEDELEVAGPGIVAVVLQLNSDGATVSDGEIDELVSAVESADTTVAVWVGPSGSSAEDEASRLVAAADVSGVPPGSRIEVTPELLDARGLTSDDLDGQAAVGENVGSGTAAELGLVDNAAPVLGDFVIELPGFETDVEDDRRVPVTDVRFGQLQLVDQLFHTVASPAVAYLLLVIGGCLLVFELFTAGVGVAGMVGAGSLLLSAYGLTVLPTATWALTVLCLSFVAFAVDVQTGVPRLWTGVGAVGLCAGSLFLFSDGPPSWITLGAGIGGTLLAMLGGMPAMVRTRFSTPTIGRDWMIGESGVAVADVSPDGVVTVRDAPWRAHTNRATPIDAGDPVTVVAIDGLVLEVEPVEGGAKDYRDRH